MIAGESLEALIREVAGFDTDALIREVVAVGERIMCEAMAR